MGHQDRNLEEGGRGGGGASVGVPVCVVEIKFDVEWREELQYQHLSTSCHPLETGV